MDARKKTESTDEGAKLGFWSLRFQKQKTRTCTRVLVTPWVPVRNNWFKRKKDEIVTTDPLQKEKPRKRKRKETHVNQKKIDFKRNKEKIITTDGKNI